MNPILPKKQRKLVQERDTAPQGENTNVKKWKLKDRFWISGAYYKNFTSKYEGIITRIHEQGPTILMDADSTQQGWTWTEFNKHAHALYEQPYIIHSKTCRLCVTDNGDTECTQCKTWFHKTCLERGNWNEYHAADSSDTLCHLCLSQKQQSQRTNPISYSRQTTLNWKRKRDESRQTKVHKSFSKITGEWHYNRAKQTKSELIAYMGIEENGFIKIYRVPQRKCRHTYKQMKNSTMRRLVRVIPLATQHAKMTRNPTRSERRTQHASGGGGGGGGVRRGGRKRKRRQQAPENDE